MARPGELTRGKSNRMIKTPGGRRFVHRKKFYRAKGTCALTGSQLQVPKSGRHDNLRGSSHSAKRANRPYGGVISSKALRRGIIKAARE